MARRADKNNDGFISTAEAKKLPVDLQDNFANYEGVPLNRALNERVTE